MAIPGKTRKVLTFIRFSEEWVERLQRLSPDLEIVYWPREDYASVPDELWRDTEILYAFMSCLPTPEQAPRLRWVQLYSAGANGILEQPLLHTDVRFTTASGVHAIAIGEYVIAMALAWFQRLPTLFHWQQERDWPSDGGEILAREEVHGKTIGIVGYGSIGRHIARLARGLSLRVLAMQRGQDHRDTGFILPGTGDAHGTLPERYYAPGDLHALLQASDIVAIALPLTPATHHLFDEQAFKAMRSTALLVNIARGDICDEEALVHALREHWIAGAALDVFQQEPMPRDNPLWQLPNVIVSPHISGFHAEYDEHTATLFEQNLRRYLADEPMYNLVDKTQGY